MGKTFIQKFVDFIEKEGELSITVFLNKWIKEGGTFSSLHKYLNKGGIKVHYFTMYLALRNYITVPYDYHDQYQYKWGKLAKKYGYDDVSNFILYLSRKYTSVRSAKILGVTTRNFLYMVEKARAIKGVSTNKRIVDSQGFSSEVKRQEWDKKMYNLGFRSLKKYVTNRRKNNWRWKEISSELNICIASLFLRMKRAKIDYKSLKKGGE